MSTLEELIAEITERVQHVAAPSPDLAACLIRSHADSHDPDRWKSIATIALAQEWAGNGS